LNVAVPGIHFSETQSPVEICPCLSATRAWDKPESLRGELLSTEVLERHAAEISRSHGVPAGSLLQGPLRATFNAARTRIHKAYAVLIKSVPNRRDLSPAEEWLIDNSHVVHSQLREVETDLPAGYLVQLPRLARGVMAEFPCVYALCLDYLRHTDARLDLESLTRYVASYQTVRNLTIGELWAVPIMLRLGLILRVGALAASEADSDDRLRGDTWAKEFFANHNDAGSAQATVKTLAAQETRITAPFLVHLLRRLREHDASFGAAFEWIGEQSVNLGFPPEELARHEHLRQAADQVSVGNAITSMRAIAAFDWNLFFEETSAVEATLQSDPLGAYAETEAATRDRYRHAVEDLARHSHGDEVQIARAAIGLAAREPQTVQTAKRHVGYYLVGKGRRELERSQKYRPRVFESLRRTILDSPTGFYLGSLALVGTALVILFVMLLTRFPDGVDALSFWSLTILGALAILPASEIAVTIVNVLVPALLPPKLLAKLAFAKGIPSEFTTLVAVPALLDSEAGIANLLADLEIRSLANADENLYFALITDFVDHEQENDGERDSRLLEAVVQGITALNQRHLRQQKHRFSVFHRRRLHNPRQGCWMGWERKRGKLDELNAVLRGNADTSFTHITLPAHTRSSIRYVITLDADTSLPREVARRLVATIAHPLNRALTDATGKILEGHALIQPGVGTLPMSARSSKYARIMSGQVGIDPYTSASSDVYQDLFEQGSYVGKAIYDVDAFSAAVAGRVPENRLLSHDLFEGLLCHAALASDIQLYDEQPSSYHVVASRQHRWIRGDWQLIAWLFPRVPGANGVRKNDLSLIARWKLFDNLRRSLSPVFLLLLLFGSLCAGIWPTRLAVLFILSVFAVPAAGRLLVSLLRPKSDTKPSFSFILRNDVSAEAIRGLLGLVFLMDQGLISVDAIARTLYRLLVSNKNLLEWQTMRQAEHRAENTPTRKDTRMAVGSALSLFSLAFISITASRTSALVWLWAGPLVLGWLLAPALAKWLTKPMPPIDRTRQLLERDRAALRLCARKTWLFFETFVTREDHFLPPDNYQEVPRGAIAHRTSPTNIGLYLLSIVAARDFGYLSLDAVAERLLATLTTIEALEKRNGHVLNWYDTTTLAPLEPRYVSTVDSGNLAAYLWTLREACSELWTSPLLTVATLDGALDAIRLSASLLGSTLHTSVVQLEVLERNVREAKLALTKNPHQGSPILDALIAKMDEVIAITADPNPWLARARRQLDEARLEVLSFSSFQNLLEGVPQSVVLNASLAPRWDALCLVLQGAGSPEKISAEALRADALIDTLMNAALAELSAQDFKTVEDFLMALRLSVQDARGACDAIEEKLSRTGKLAGALADEMNFKFLYNEEQALFSIGYNESGARLDASHYDLLASEARLASLVAIAKGDVPLEHWSRLGRARTGLMTGSALLSWSGSMFEYLMPLLVTRSYERTLLDETYVSMVARQRAYGDEQDVPWGISESAYNMMDLTMTYQYRAFGVSGLGLKGGLANDLVVAPYATALALMVDPKAATINFHKLTEEGLDGEYGYYDAIDYTPARVPPGRKSVVVKAYMAHHQGMTLLALGNVLFENCMQRRFHAYPPIKASELLLEERVPAGARLTELRAPVTAPLASASDAELSYVEHLGLHAPGPLRAHLLGHGELSTLVTAHGTGAMTWKGRDVHRFREDRAAATGGVFVFLRDLSTDRCWSAGYEPTQAQPDRYDVALAPDRVEIRRTDGAIETVMEVGVSPEHAAEVRRITLTNHGTEEKTVEVTTYMEPVLAHRAADVAHRAFSNMFIEVEALPDRFALMARRRQRSPEDDETWVVQVLACEGGDPGPFEFETSREAFIGRGNRLQAPAALKANTKLAGKVGASMDPALVLRRTVTLLPGKVARFSISTALASSREAALRLTETYAEVASITRTFELGWADARVELRHLGMTGAAADRAQRLLSAVLFPIPELRHRADPETIRGRSQGALWRLGVSGDLPVIVLRIDHPDFAELAKEVLFAQEFWRLNGVTVDVVIFNEELSGYNQPLQEGVLALVRSSPAHARMEQPGGVFVCKADLVLPNERTLILSYARVVLAASKGSLGRQLRKAAGAVAPGSHALAAKSMSVKKTEAVAKFEGQAELQVLSFDNGFGGFRSDGREYVMRVEPESRSPAPWCNVIANPIFGMLVSESGTTCTWSQNSQTHRLTPWSNDAVSDPSGEVIYLRDEADGSFWSATPGPLYDAATYEVRHGQGYSVFEHTRHQLSHELTLFVDRNRPVRFARLRLKNNGSRKRKLSVASYIEWVLGNTRERSRLTVVTQVNVAAQAILAFNPAAVFPERRAFLGVVAQGKEARISYTADRAEFIGNESRRAAPEGLFRTALSGLAGAGLDPCGALLLHIEIEAGETSEVTFLLGDEKDEEHALALLASCQQDKAVESALQSVIEFWNKTLGTLTVKTPEKALDLLVNRWLPYQTLSARVWARSGFYQSGGAYGFRDQLQDVLALLHSHPELAREQIVRSAARQFFEGDVQHWWHPETGEGVRTRCSDDMLWLPYVTAEYVRATGDLAILDVQIAFLKQAELLKGENDHFASPETSLETAPLYEHCLRALARGTTTGIHGLPLMLGGDWNDGMSRIGIEGHGESIWLGWFLAKTLRDFSVLCDARGEPARKLEYLQTASRLCAQIDIHGWDGQWYLRAFFDDGFKVGSSQNTECRIDAIAQSWAAIAGGGNLERARLAVSQSERMLAAGTGDEAMMLLFTPPFVDSDPSPGYIQGYPAGVRENGGQYTHGVLWTALAHTALGDGERAVSLLKTLAPITHARSREGAVRYAVEPYVVVADVYSGSARAGRGGWSWYTGSAAWMYRIFIENVLGLTLTGGKISFKPCIPPNWPSFEIDYRVAGGSLHITVENPHKLSTGTSLVTLNGLAVPNGVIDMPANASHGIVRVVLSPHNVDSKV
jgi:cyclic beta-1,2-glucan synthetase